VTKSASRVHQADRKTLINLSGLKKEERYSLLFLYLIEKFKKDSFILAKKSALNERMDLFGSLSQITYFCEILLGFFSSFYLVFWE